jgi:hypothetical protein
MAWYYYFSGKYRDTKQDPDISLAVAQDERAKFVIFLLEECLTKGERQAVEPMYVRYTP